LGSEHLSCSFPDLPAFERDVSPFSESGYLVWKKPFLARMGKSPEAMREGCTDGNSLSSDEEKQEFTSSDQKEADQQHEGVAASGDDGSTAKCEVPPATEIFTRFIACKGETAYRELAASSVLIVGVGAVGGFALETVARCGVGRIALIDFDVIEASNINRQILASVPDIGRRKVEVARERVKTINPYCVIQTFCEKVDGPRFAELCAQIEPDVVIEAIDMFHQKGEVIAHCIRTETPIVSSMGAARKTNPSLIRLGGLSEAKVCPLAHKVTQKLRQLGVDLSFQEGRRGSVVCVYSSERPQPHPKDVDGRKLSLSSFNVITSMFGVWAAHAAIAYLIDKRFPSGE